MKRKNTEFIVGLFVLFGLGLMAVMVIQFGRLGDGLEDSYIISVQFEDATGVIKGSEVRMGGAVIGKTVDRPVLNEESTGVNVPLRIRGDVSIPEGSSFQIASLNFLGDRFIEIKPPMIRTGNFIADGEVVRGKDEGGLAAIQKQAEDLSDQATKTMKKLDDSLTNIDGVIDDVKAATASIASVTEKVDQRLLADENLDRFDRSLENFDVAMAGVKQLSEKVGPMVDKVDGTLDETDLAIKDVRELIGTAKGTFAKTNEKLDQLDPAFEELPATLKSFKGALAKVSKTMDGLTTDKGLLGALTTDSKMKRDAKEFLSNLREYGILRYRDPEGKDQELPDLPKTRRR